MEWPQWMEWFQWTAVGVSPASIPPPTLFSDTKATSTTDKQDLTLQVKKKMSS